MKEEEIRPRRVFDEYLRLAALDADIYFGKSDRQPILCPACQSPGVFAFNKHGFSYEECPICHTLYVSPRPPATDFFRYYQESASASYFATTFYKETAEARRDKLWRPKAAMVHDILRKHGVDNFNLFDIGGGYGIFAEEYQRLADVNVTVIEPGPESAQVCRDKGLHVIESFLENVHLSQLPSGRKVFVSFELFEHLHDCGLFLEKLSSLMQPGDLFLFTTLSSLGVDIQTLWDESNSVSLQHLNFLNPVSVRNILARTGYRVLSVETPGKLDLDILSNNRSIIKDRFWRNFMELATDVDRQRWQEFIASQGFSSHMLVVSERSPK